MGVGFAIKGIGISIGAIGAVFGGLAAIVASPLLPWIIGIGAAVAGLVALITAGWSTIQAGATTAFGVIWPWIEKFIEVLRVELVGLMGYFASTWSALGALVGELFKSFGEGFTAMAPMVSLIGSLLATGVIRILEIGLWVLEKIIKAITWIVKLVRTGLTPLASLIGGIATLWANVGFGLTTGPKTATLGPPIPATPSAARQQIAMPRFPAAASLAQARPVTATPAVGATASAADPPKLLATAQKQLQVLQYMTKQLGYMVPRFA